MLQDDMKRMEYTPHQYYNFHPAATPDREQKSALNRSPMP